MGKQEDKEACRQAIAAYLVEYGDAEVPISDLRSFVHGRTGIGFNGPTLAAFLRASGFVRDGIRKIESCPGQTVFYVRAAR